MKSVLVLLGVVAGLMIAASNALACYEEMSDEDLVSKSDLIVVGKIVKIDEGGTKPTSKSIAAIEVERVIKGDKTKSVKLAFPSRRRNMMASTDIFYDKGQDGVWLLTKVEDKDYYMAAFPTRFQPKENADKIAAIVEEQKNGPPVEKKPEREGLDPWKKKVIDEWIAENGLNKYGDSKDTVYLGGTPLFDEKTGRSIDRYEYIYMNHAEVRKLIAEKARGAVAPPEDMKEPEKKPVVSEEMQEKIDKWLRDKKLNRYGDPKGTMYTGGTPLFNEKTGESIDRYEYVLKKFPKLLEELR